MQMRPMLAMCSRQAIALPISPAPLTSTKGESGSRAEPTLSVFANDPLRLAFDARQAARFADLHVGRDGDAVLDDLHEVIAGGLEPRFGNVLVCRLDADPQVLAAPQARHDELVFLRELVDLVQQLLYLGGEDVDAGEVEHVVRATQHPAVEPQVGPAAGAHGA